MNSATQKAASSRPGYNLPEESEYLKKVLRAHLRYGGFEKGHAVDVGTAGREPRLTIRESKMGTRKMLYSLIALLLAIWVVGLFMHIGGGFIHTLLAIALVIFVYDLLVGRRAV